MSAVYLILSVRAFAQFFPIFKIPAATQIVLAPIDSYRTAFTELEIVTVCTFYYVTALFALDLIYDNLL